MILHSHYNFHCSAHLNTSTCDCAPQETIDSLQMQVPSAKRSHMPALTTSCSLQPCSTRAGPASGVTHHLHHIGTMSLEARHIASKTWCQGCQDNAPGFYG